MLPNRIFLFYLMLIIIVVIRFGENTTCTPNKLIYLSNCSFDYSYYHNRATYHLLNNITTKGNRALSMILSYPLTRIDDDHLSTTIIKNNRSTKPLIRFNLNLIECVKQNLSLKWTSLETSSTLNGEFVRTTFIDRNTMYLPMGKTYLKNLTAIDCSTNIAYRTDSRQLFALDLHIESTLNDHCFNDNSCYPYDTYQCDKIKQRCICRQPLQSYLIDDQYPICLHIVHQINQCTMKNVRCLEWCHQNSSSRRCTCPKNLARKIFLEDDRAYCESRTGGICNSFIQCPFNDICVNGICQNKSVKSYSSISLNIVAMSIMTLCLIIFMISVILGISMHFIRRQRWRKAYLTPVDPLDVNQSITIPKSSNYDNVTYEAFRHNVQVLSADDSESIAIKNSDDPSSYEPRIVYLGGEQQLTAIFA